MHLKSRRYGTELCKRPVPAVFFEISRAMLNNENSPYYPLIEDVLKHMDKEKLIDFGLNIGYNGCTTGAHMIRKLKRTEDINVPWLLSLVIDTSLPDFITKYDSVLKQGKELGIYTYFLYTKDDPQKYFLLSRITRTVRSSFSVILPE